MPTHASPRCVAEKVCSDAKLNSTLGRLLFFRFSLFPLLAARTARIRRAALGSFDARIKARRSGSSKRREDTPNIGGHGPSCSSCRVASRRWSAPAAFNSQCKFRTYSRSAIQRALGSATSTFHPRARGAPSAFLATDCRASSTQRPNRARAWRIFNV